MTMSTSLERHNAEDYEQRYRSGYGLQYPESHVIRVHKQILEWELGVRTGTAFDFGCGAGANLKYFRDREPTWASVGKSRSRCEPTTESLKNRDDNHISI